MLVTYTQKIRFFIRVFNIDTSSLFRILNELALGINCLYLSS